MSSSAILQVILEGKNKTSAAFNEAQGSMEGLRSKLKDFGAQAMKTGGLMTAGITTPLALMAAKAVSAASDLQESLSKVGVVFGDNAAQIIDWSETASTALGVTQQQALESAGTFGNLFSAMGIGLEASSDMSMGLVQLAADLASFNNIDPTEALEKLRAGLVGEAEPLRTLGVNLTAAATEARAMAMGLAATTDELTPAMLAQARYSLIMEQSALAQGDFARTSEGLANQTRIVKAQIGDLAAQIGTALLPFVTQAVQFISGLVTKFMEMDAPVRNAILIVAGLAAAAGPVLMVVGALASGLGLLLSPIGLVVAAVAGLALAFATDFAGIRTAVMGALQPVIDTFQTLIAGIGPLIDWLAQLILYGEDLGELYSLIPDQLRPVADILARMYDVIYMVADVIQAQLISAGEMLVQLWTDRIAPALEIVRAALEDRLFPAFSTFAEWLGATIPPIIEAVGGFLTDTLLPALAGVASFIIGTVVPVIIELAAWLLENIPVAIEAASRFFETTLKPALETIWQFIQDNVIPILQKVGTWLSDNIPVAIQTASDYWEDVLQPALETVWQFIEDNVIPIFETVVEWLQDNIPPALQTLSDFWETVLLPAISAVWEFITTYLVPLFTKLVEVEFMLVKLALAEMANIWETILKPAIELVWKFLTENVIPALVDLKAKLDGPVTTALNAVRLVFDKVAGAISGIGGVIKDVIGWLDGLISKIQEALDWLKQVGGGGEKGATRGLANDIGEMADAIGQLGGALTDIAPSADILQRVGSALKAMVDALTAVAGYGSEPVGPNLQRLIDQFGAVIRKLERAAAEFGAEGLAAAVALAEAMGKIGNGLKAAAAGLEEVAGYTEAKVGPNLQRLIDQYGAVIRKLVRAAAEFDELGYQSAERLAAAMGAIGSKLEKAVDGLTAVAAYTLAARLDLAIGQFVDDWSRMIAALVVAGDKFDDKGLTAAERLAEAMGAIGKELKNAVEGLLAIVGYGSDLDFVVQMQRFVDDLMALALALALAVTALGDDVLKQLIRAAEFADPISRLVSVVRGGMDALMALASYTGSSSRGDIVLMTRRFARDLVSLAEELRRAFNQLPDELLLAYDSAVEFASRVSALVGVVRPGMDAVLAMASYVRANNLAQAVTAFAGDVLVVAEGLREALGSLPQATLDSYDQAVEFAQRIQALVGFIKPAMDALQELSRYGGGAATALHAGMEKLTRNVASLVNFLASHYAILGSNAVSQAQTFAESIVGIVTAIRRGLEEAAGIEGINATYDGAFVTGQNWITGIVDGITSRLSDLEDLMAYIRGLFPSSPAQYGPWRDLPQGNDVSKAWLASMTQALRQTGELERSLAGVRGMYAGVGAGAYVGPGGWGAGAGAGGGNVTVNLSMAGPFYIRQDADIEKLATAVGDVIARQASLTRRKGLQRV